MGFLDEGYYTKYYEKAIEADVKLLAQNSGYETVRTTVLLNEAYEVEEMELHVAKQEVETVVIGKDGKDEKDGLLLLRDKIAAYYRIGPDKIKITD